MSEKKSKKHNRLRPSRVVDIPLQEVSGICLRREAEGRKSIVAVGDRAAMLASLHLREGDTEFSDWQTIDISRFAGTALPANDSQIEAICADGRGHVLLLQESPPRAELLDLNESRVVATISLEVDANDELGRSWADPDGSRGEGAVLLPGGHLLIAKEKDPPALIEFGPRGSKPLGFAPGGALADGAHWEIAEGAHRYVPLAVWRPDKAMRKACDDISDLDVGPDGRLYLLSDQSATIARLDELSPSSNSASMSASWKLLEIDGKPEGLAFSATGCAVVALDKRKASNNLLLLEPAIAGDADA